MMEGHQRNHIGILDLGIESDVTLAMILTAKGKCNWVVANTIIQVFTLREVFYSVY